MSFLNLKRLTRKELRCSEAEALAALEKAADGIVRNASWHPYRTTINELRKPLLQLRLARRPQRTTKP